jgi:hypothetical protein
MSESTKSQRKDYKNAIYYYANLFSKGKIQNKIQIKPEASMSSLGAKCSPEKRHVAIVLASVANSKPGVSRGSPQRWATSYEPLWP